MSDRFIRASGKLDANVPQAKVLTEESFPPTLVSYDPFASEADQEAGQSPSTDLSTAATLSLLNEPSADADAEAKKLLASVSLQQTSVRFRPKPHWVLDEEYMDLHVSADRMTIRLQRKVREDRIETIALLSQPPQALQSTQQQQQQQQQQAAKAEDSAAPLGATVTTTQTLPQFEAGQSPQGRKRDAGADLPEEFVGPTPLNRFVGQIWGQPGFLSGVHVWHARVNDIATRLILGIIQKPVPKGHNSTLCSYGYSNTGHFYENNEMTSGRENTRLAIRFAKGDVLTFVLDLDRALFCVFHRMSGFAHSQKVFPNGHHFYVYAFLEGAGTCVTFSHPVVVEEKKGIRGIFS